MVSQVDLLRRGELSQHNKLFIITSITHKTKLKLDKEVGGGDLSDLCTITYLIAYPYAWTLNFGNCIDLQLTTHQPPRNFSSCSLEPQVYRILKWWNGEFPYWIRNHFLRVRDLNFSLGKSGRFRTSGSTFWSRSTGGRFDRFRSGT